MAGKKDNKRQSPSSRKSAQSRQRKQKEKEQQQKAQSQADDIIDNGLEDTNDGSTIQLNDDDIQESNYSPFDEPVTKREYTIPNIDPSELAGELHEPIFSAPSYDENEDDQKDKEEAQQPKAQKEPLQFNESFSQLPNKEKKMGAEKMADIVLDGYERLGKGMGALAKISEAKMDREYADGTINPNMAVPIDEMGNTCTVREYVEEFNNEVGDAFETSEKFKEDVRPPLVRVFQKRGVGMTDEQQLLYYFGTDIASKGITAVGLKKSSNAILEQLRQHTDMLRGQQMPPTSTQSAHYQAETPPPSPSPEQSQPVGQQEYHEPEENKGEMIEPIVMDANNNIVVKEGEGFAPEQKYAGMPEFGDKQLLADMEKLARREEERAKNKNKKDKS